MTFAIVDLDLRRAPTGLQRLLGTPGPLLAAASVALGLSLRRGASLEVQLCGARAA